MWIILCLWFFIVAMIIAISNNLNPTEWKKIILIMLMFLSGIFLGISLIQNLDITKFNSKEHSFRQDIKNEFVNDSLVNSDTIFILTRKK